MRTPFSFLCLALLLQGCSDANSEDSTAEKRLSLESKLPSGPGRANVVTLRQGSLPILEETFVVPDYKEEMTPYVQTDVLFPLVDILIVVDNSGSMSEEQIKLAEKMQPLLSQLVYVDWQINVISTDNPCSTREYLPLRSGIDTGDLLHDKFFQAINIGIFGSATERPLLMAKLNITETPGGKSNCAPKPWLRDNAKLVIFFLTDEDERNSAAEPSKENAESIFSTLEEKNFSVGKTAKIYGIFSHPSKPCNSASFNDKGAPILANLIEKAQGLWGDICSNDYSKILGDVSEDIAQLFKVSIELKYVPAPESLAVYVNGENHEQAFWKVVGAYLVLQKPLDVGDELEVFYKRGFLRELPLNFANKPKDLKIHLDDKPLEARDFRFIEKNRAVHFNQVLSPNTEVKIRYKDDAALEKEFGFPAQENADGIYCYLESGQEIPHDYYPGDEIIYFEEPPPELSKVTCLFY